MFSEPHTCPSLFLLHSEHVRRSQQRALEAQEGGKDPGCFDCCLVSEGCGCEGSGGVLPQGRVSEVTLQPQQEKTSSQPCGLETHTPGFQHASVPRRRSANACADHLHFEGFPLGSHPFCSSVPCAGPGGWVLTQCTGLCPRGCSLLARGLLTGSGLGKPRQFSVVSGLSSLGSELQPWEGGPFQVGLSVSTLLGLQGVISHSLCPIVTHLSEFNHSLY